jgi:L-cystine transport system substrate-binding protein
MKKLLSLLSLLLAFTVVLAACGSSEQEEAKNTNNTAAEKDLYTQVKNSGVLTIGTEGVYPPFTFHDDSNKLTGYDVEVAEEVAKRLGVKAQFEETQWDGMFAGLDAKRFDMIANQVGIRPDRQEKYDFSDPYTESSAVLVVHENNNEIKSFEDLKGKNSAQSLTSNYADIAKSNGATLTGIEGFTQAVELIVAKRVDATVNDKISFLDYKKQKPDAPVKVVATAEDVSQTGLMFRKDSGKLVEELNKALQAMKKDGTLTKISQKWFGEDVSPK